MSDARTRRLAERISKLVAELLERRIKDPRLGFVTVTEVRLTGDWREAKVFYTVFGTPEEQAEMMKTFSGAVAQVAEAKPSLNEAYKIVSEAAQRTK